MDGHKKRRGPPRKTTRQRGVEKHYNLRQTARRQREGKISTVLKSSLSSLPTRVTDGVYLEFRPKSAGCSRDEMMDEDEAESIRASRGNYDVEVSCTGEGGLPQRRTKCDKNPGHLNFIPVKDFNIEHLPSAYRDNLLVDYVQAQSDVTCRLFVSRISGNRPDTWPDSDQPYPFSKYRGKKWLMTGTGWVSMASNCTEEENIKCECNECLKPGNTPKKTWGYVDITTARHVVYDNEEARHTKCQFFYDFHETDIKKVLTLTEGEVKFIDVTRDWCTMEYIIHDVELVDRFYKMLRRWEHLRVKVFNKYLSNKSPGLCVPGVGCDTNVDHDLCIIVSHPHGCSKVVSVGAWTHRNVLDEDWDHDEEDSDDNDEEDSDNEEDSDDEEDSDGGVQNVTYRYSTPTCPGSSGAAVFTLYKNINTNAHLDLPLHSKGRPGNDNNSGVGREYLNKRLV